MRGSSTIKYTMKMIIYILLIYAPLFTQDLQLTISIEKDTFLIGERIYVDLELKNISSQDVKVTILWDGYVNRLIFFNIINSYGENEDYNGLHVDFGATNPILKPNDVEKIINDYKHINPKLVERAKYLLKKELEEHKKEKP
jgi:hypothetical protein